MTGTTTAKARELDEAMVQAQQEIARLERIVEHTATVYGRSRWTRFYVVPGGHVHSSTSCHTCYPTTMFVFVPQYSGMPHSEMVELAGERACTVCFPDAPVATRTRPTSVWTPEELAEREAKQAEQAQRAATKASKGITNPDGTPLRGEYGVLKTERGAELEAIASLASGLWYGMSHPSYSTWQQVADRVAHALAYKRGTDAQLEMAKLEDKARIKDARERKAAAKHAKALGLA
jgi:hypothetical protein